MQTGGVRDVKFLLRECRREDIPFFLRTFAHYFERYTQDSVAANRFDVVTVGGERYLLVYKNRLIDSRVKDIIYEEN